VPEEYLKAKEERDRQQRQRAALRARQRQQETEQLDRLYDGLSPRQRAEVDREVEARIPPVLWAQIKQQASRSEPLSATNAILQGYRREVLREWLSEGKVEA